MKGFLLIASLAAVSTWAGCGPKGVPASTGDETKSAAKELQPGLPADDKVSRKRDPVDWKRFVVQSTTTATVNVYWDDPAIQARIVLRDTFGGKLAETDHREGAGKDTLGGLTLREGTYFLEIRALDGSSVYTVEVLLGDPGAGGAYGVPRPE